MTDKERFSAAAVILRKPPEAVFPVLREIAIFVRDFEDQTDTSPLRAPFRKKLLKLLGKVERWDRVLADEEASGGERGRAPALNLSVSGKRQSLRAGVAQCQDLPSALGEFSCSIETQMLRCIIAQWVSRKGDLWTSQGRSALAAGLRARLSCLEPHQGSDRITDALGVPRARLFCAVAAADLYEIFTGRKPGHSNPKVRELCALIWAIAGCAPMPGQQSSDNNDDAWGRHLRKIWTGNIDILLEAHSLVRDIVRRNGCLSLVHRPAVRHNMPSQQEYILRATLGHPYDRRPPRSDIAGTL